MIAIRTILCPVDFSAASARQVDLAANLCRAFQAQLVLHHNLPSLAPGAGVGWMWAADHPPMSEETVRERLAALAGTRPGLKVETKITRGPTLPAVLAVSGSAAADLVVLSTHNAPAEEHASVTERVLEQTQRSVLVLHDTAAEHNALTFDLSSGHRQVTIVPTDLTPESGEAVDFAFELARTLPLDVHLLHLLPRGRPVPFDHDHDHERAVANAERQMQALVPRDCAAFSSVHVREGDPAHGILQVAIELAAACIIMGEHTRAPLRRLLSRDTSRAVLHQAPCPVWYVPGQRT